MNTPDTYPKPSEEQVKAHMDEVRAALAEAKRRAKEQAKKAGA